MIDPSYEDNKFEWSFKVVYKFLRVVKDEISGEEAQEELGR